MRGMKIVTGFVFLLLCSPVLPSSHQESTWRGNPLRVSPFQRSLRSLPPFLGRGIDPRPATKGVSPLGYPDERFPMASRGAYSRSSTGRSRSSVTAGDIVKRFIQAVGGSELVNVGTEKRTGTLIRGVSGAVPFEMISEASGKWYYHQVFAYGDGVSYGFDGGQAWIQDTEGTSGLPPQKWLELTLLLDIQAPLKLKSLFPRMTLKGPEKIGQKEAVVLSAVSGEGFGTELAFDGATGLLLRAGDLFFEDYRDVGKVKRPFLVLFGKDSGPNPLRLKMQVSEIRQDIDVNESVFMRPACSLRPVPPLFYKLRKEVPVGQESLEACVGVYQSNSDPNVLYTVTTQGPHLMIERTGWGTRVEIRPESETDYFMRFLHRDFHFVKDAAGRVMGLEMGTDRAQKAKKIK
jgi:hypothetical protein